MQLKDDLYLIPNLSISYERMLILKQQKIRARFAWMKDDFTDTPKGYLGKNIYNFGAGIGIAKNNTQISLSYNGRVEQKLISHQGALKLKLMF